MKRLLSIAVSTLALAAVAEYSPTIGVTEIQPTLKNTVIPVLYSSLTNGNVSADSLVSTEELDENTELYVFQNDSYTGWMIDEGKWVPLESANTKSGIGIPDPNQALAAGSAVWLIFPANQIPQKVYIYGQVVTSKSWTIERAKNNLLCNPTGAPMTGSAIVAKLASASVLATRDKIVPIGPTYAGEYIYAGAEKGWKKMNPNGTIDKNVNMGELSIPANSAFWYYSAGTGETVTIPLGD